MSIVLFFYPLDSIFNRYSYVTIGLIHFFTLGILAQIIFGALQQMLPVLAGTVFKKPILFANIVHISLIIGSIGLSSGFIFDVKFLLLIGSVFLSISFGLFFITLIKLLFKVQFLTPTINTMKLFSIAGFVTAFLGIYLLIQHIILNIDKYHYLLVSIHIFFAIFGFAMLLVIAVSFQVIPMFYVANDFPKYIQKRFPQIIFGLLFLFAIWIYIHGDAQFHI